MSKKKWIIIVIVVVAIGAVGFGGMQYISAQNAGSAELPVMETIVARDTITTKVTSKGEVSLLNTHLIYANIAAEVDEVLVEKNDIVTEGQPLIRYREKAREDLERDIQKSRLDVQDAELALSTAKIPPSTATVEEAKLAVESAQNDINRTKSEVTGLDADILLQMEKLENARGDLRISETLLAANAIAQNEVDTERRQLRNLEAELETLQQRRTNKLADVAAAEETLRFRQIAHDDIVNKLSSPMSQNTIRQYEIALEKARLALSERERELADFQQEIVSPVSGAVTMVSVSKGEITPTDKSLMEIADVSDYIIKVDVNERNAAKIAVGQDVNLTGSALGNETLTGKVTKIGYIAETKQNNSSTERVVPVEITVDKNGDLLKPGFSLDATIIAAVNENVIAIPILSTLSESDGTNYVFVIKDDNTLEKRAVTLGAYEDMSVEAEGVQEGEKIVSQPTVDMTDGMAVTVTNREPAAEAEGGAEAEPTGGTTE